MSVKKALLIFDPARRAEQINYVSQRTETGRIIGDQWWVAITEAQAQRFSEQGILVQFFPAADFIDLPAAYFNPAEREPEIPQELAATTPSGEHTAYYMVQFIAPPDAEYLEDVEELGGVYIEDQPVHAAVFRLTAGQADEVRALENVSWIGIYHPVYALSYELAGREEPFGAVDLRQATVDPAQIQTTETGTLEVNFFDDVSLETIRPEIEAAGATIVTDTGYNFVVDIDAANVLDLLRIPGVQSVERYVPGEEGNQRAGVIVGADQVRSFNQINFMVNLDGRGEIAGVIDSGLDAGGPPALMHPDLGARVLQVNNLYGAGNPTADPLPHGTHVVGSVAGDGTQTAAWGGPAPANPSNVRGMAPDSQIIFHSARQPTAADPNARNYAGFMTGLLNAHNAGARVHSNSWASPAVVTNNNYNNTSRIIDRFAYINPESLVLFLAHNQERDTQAPVGVLDMRSLPRQSVAKNILCIGACENRTNRDGTAQTYRALWPGRYNNNAFNATAGAPPIGGNFPISDNTNNMALFSNRGRVSTPGAPDDQRRIKPDLVAPGTNIISLGPLAMLPFAAAPRRPNTAPPNFYYVDSGTSMATPIAAGCAVLTRQFYRERFGQLRRPVLMQHINQFVDTPTIAAHASGSVMAWIRHDGGQNHIVAARYSRDLARVGNIVQLQTNVGDHPVPMVGRHGDDTLLLHRAADNSLRLSCYDNNLNIVNAFGTNGVVTLSPASRNEADRPPALCVRDDEVAVVWHQTATDNLVMQRFNAQTGAQIGGTIQLGSASNTSTHAYAVHDGTHYAVVWMRHEGSDYSVRLRLVDNSGNVVGADASILHQQAEQIRDPHITLAQNNRFLIAWVDSRHNAHGDIYTHLTQQDGTGVGTPSRVIQAPAGNEIRRPFVARHPRTGHVLLWEDNTQPGDQGNFHHDVYFVLLNNGGLLPGPLVRDSQRISDTPFDTEGFSCLVDASAITSLWQSNDEINADQRGVYALNITQEGAFQAQQNPDTPLLNSARYVRHTLVEHGSTDLTPVAMTWSGGNYYLMRAIQGGFPAEMHLVRTNADGLPDSGFGNNGARSIEGDIAFESCALHWAGRHVIALTHGLMTISVLVFESDGNAVAAFGDNGTRSIDEFNAPEVFPQVQHRYRGNNLRVIVAYGRRRRTNGDTQTDLRYMLFNQIGNPLIGPLTLRQADGTARHGWFQYIESNNRQYVIVWHRAVDADGNQLTHVFLNLFRLNGTAVRANVRVSSALDGESRNAVVAPRSRVFEPPVPTPAGTAALSRRREFGVAWQFLPSPTVANPNPTWEIRFSRIRQNGNFGPTRDVAVVSGANHATHPQLIWHTNGYGLAWLEQAPAGGAHTLFFTVIDQDGARVDLRTPGAAAPVPVGSYQLSTHGADVQDYELIWNGRVFRVTWTEVQNGRLRHMQTAMIVPRQANLPNAFNQPYHHPTSALIRATLINGATNMRRTALPNIGPDPNDGYGWGRINLRQSLAPLPPVTFHVRDDGSVASGQTISYRFRLPVNTRLLRITLAWTDPPDVRLVNNLNLRMTTPDNRVFVGNRWAPGGPPAAEFSDPLPTPPPPNPFEGVHNVEQIKVADAPNLPPGEYLVEVIGGSFRNNIFQQFPGQTFALVFVGSGTEILFPGMPAPADVPVY